MKRNNKSQTINAILHRNERERINNQISELKKLGFIVSQPSILRAPRTTQNLTKIQDITVEDLAKSAKYIDPRSGETFTGLQGLSILEFRGELSKLDDIEFGYDLEIPKETDIIQQNLLSAINDITTNIEDYLSDPQFLWHIKEPILYEIQTVLYNQEYDVQTLIENQALISDLLSQIYYASKQEDIYIPEARILQYLGVDSSITDEIINKSVT